jgi:hypothetical protein
MFRYQVQLKTPKRKTHFILWAEKNEKSPYLRKLLLKIGTSDSMFEYQVLETRNFWLIFVYSKVQVNGPSNRALNFFSMRVILVDNFLFN